MNGWKKMYHENMNQRVPGLDILILDKVDFRVKKIREGGYYITIKVSIHEEESNLKYVYTKQQNCRMVKKELKEMKGKIDFQL